MGLPPVRVLGVFSGVLGLEMGVTEGLRRVGRDARVVGLVERSIFAVAVTLAAQDRGEFLAGVPVWTGDVREFPAGELRGAVDLVCGGFPCADTSQIGGREGLDGAASGLWWAMRDVVREVGPKFVFVENPPGLLHRGFGEVLGSLAELGFNAEWCVLPACAVGAPHLRERVFILAVADPHGDRVEGVEPPRAEKGPTIGSGWGRPYRGVHRVPDGLPRPLDELAALGRSCVPAQAALAFETLYRRMRA